VGKKGKDKFHACVIKALNMVRIEHLRKFSAKARQFMLTYSLFDNSADDNDFARHGLSHKEMELFVNTEMKVQQSCLDLEYGYISHIWRESQAAEHETA